jgi:small neutral amino acid transporter SnatA (MarC family)
LLRNAGRIIKMVGNQSIEIFSRVIGLLIAAMAVEFVMRGAIDYIHHASAIIIPIL